MDRKIKTYKKHKRPEIQHNLKPQKLLIRDPADPIRDPLNERGLKIIPTMSINKF